MLSKNIAFSCRVYITGSVSNFDKKGERPKQLKQNVKD